MSKKHNNYNKMFDDEAVQDSPEVVETPSFENASNEVVTEVENEPTPEVVTAEVVKFGVVNCQRLNVRQHANKDAAIVMVVKKDDKLIINVDESTEDFYKVEVKVDGRTVNGYCVKTFINVD